MDSFAVAVKLMAAVMILMDPSFTTILKVAIIIFMEQPSATCQLLVYKNQDWPPFTIFIFLYLIQNFLLFLYCHFLLLLSFLLPYLYKYADINRVNKDIIYLFLNYI